MAPESDIRLERLAVGNLETNCYLVYDSRKKEGVIIDPGAWQDLIRSRIEQLAFHPLAIILTHAHLDHCGAARSLKKSLRLPVYVHEQDRALLNSPLNLELTDYLQVDNLENADFFYKNGERLLFNGLEFEVFHAPGHTPGSSLLYLRQAGWLFSGDVLFAGDIGRTDLIGGSDEEMARSLQMIKEFPPETEIFPGHGPSTTLKSELQHNPYLP